VLGRGPFPKPRDPQAPRSARLDLRQVDLRRADLIDAHLEGAVLGRAHLEWALLQEARLDGAFLQATHLEGAELTGTLLRGAHADARTSWPQGFDWRAAGVGEGDVTTTRDEDETLRAREPTAPRGEGDPEPARDVRFDR